MGLRCGYNDVGRCDNYMDYFATTGVLHNIFLEPLYGYFYHSHQCGPRDRLTFSLFFVDPFDPVLDKHNDPNGFCKNEVEGFSEVPKTELSPEISGMQINPLQYDDYYAGKEDGTLLPKTVPTIDEAITNNIYFDKRHFFKRFLHKNPYQIKEFKENSILYKVTLDIPFEAIANFITVDKTLIHDGTEQIKRLYSPEVGTNQVEELFKTMERAESLVKEMGKLIRHINSHPELYKQPGKTGYGSKFNQEMREKYSSENASVMIQKVAKDFEQMRDVVFQMRYFDIKAELEELNKPLKCAHDVCVNPAALGSQYCSSCVQLNTKECNFCNRGGK